MKTTKELLCEFFEERNIDEKRRGEIARKEIFEFEKKIGKQMIQMTEDELLEMFLTFRVSKNSSNSTGYNLSYNTYSHLFSFYRDFFEHYSDTYELIPNPFYRKKKLNIRNIMDQLSDERMRDHKKYIETAIERIRANYDTPIANYLECVILLFYNGFSNSKEIVMMKEEDIDFANRTVNVNGRVVTLTERLLDLLQYVHAMEKIESGRSHKNLVISWNGSYFKHIVRVANADTLASEELNVVSKRVMARVNNYVKNSLGFDLSPNFLFMSGFYDHLIAEYGESCVYKMLCEESDGLDLVLREEGERYGVALPGVKAMKSVLRQYAPIEAIRAENEK